MPKRPTPSPLKQAKERAERARRQQAEALAALVPTNEQGHIKEDDAKRIAAALSQLMKR